MSAVADLVPALQCKARQCSVLLEALKKAPVSTIEARERLSIASPACRVYDLRRDGWHIATDAASVVDAWGRPHRVALYRLQGRRPA